MKIAYLSSSIIPSRTANSIHVMKMCQAFAKNGHEVILLAPDIKEDMEYNIEDVYDFYGVEPIFDIIKLPWISFKGKAYIYSLNVARYVRKMQPDLAYGRNLASCFFTSQICNVPIIFETHAPVINSGKISDFMFKRMLSSISLCYIVSISQSLKDYYIDNYLINKSIVKVAPDGADNPGIQNKISRNERMKIGYIGSFYYGRGIDTIIELAKKCPWADFYLCGGSDKDVYFWKDTFEGLHNIYWQGYLPHSHTELFRQNCDVLLAPYQNKVSVYGDKGDTSKWMSPLKVFEYMASGKAIVCSDLPVLREILIHNYNCLLCKPDDISSWVAALELLTNNDNFRNTLANNARKDFLNKYTWDKRAKNVLEEKCLRGT